MLMMLLQSYERSARTSPRYIANNTSKKRIKVIDSIMGAGKTQWAIQYMNDALDDQKFLYITPILTEVDRVCKACSGKNFLQPKETMIDGRKRSKSKSLVELLSNGRNIAATHELFRRITTEALQHIQAKGYTLILDEVFQVLDEEQIKQPKIEGLLDKDFLKVRRTKKQGKVKISYLDSGQEKRFDEFNELQLLAENNRLVLIESTKEQNNGQKTKELKILMWLFPNDIFQYFKEVYNLTYLFEGSLQKVYYDIFGIKYAKCSVQKDKATGKYLLVSYNTKYDDAIKQKLKPLINIYRGPLNNIGTPVRNNYPLSKSWFGRNGTFRQAVSNNRYNYLRNVVRATKGDVMWTTFKRYKEAIANGRFKSGEVSINIRGTNDYRTRFNLAYCANIFLSPNIEMFFKLNGKSINNDDYALSMLLQWIFRSRIRDQKSINIYVPSKRMRELLINW
jgi:hypothetical protein